MEILSVLSTNSIILKQKILTAYSTNEMFFTDDTVMTIAIAEDAIINGAKPENFILSMKKWGGDYIDKSYGASFINWLKSKNSEPYNSWGNGSAMRVSPCAFGLQN